MAGPDWSLLVEPYYQWMDNLVVAQERTLWRMTYVGPPLIFQFDEVERSRGLLTPGAASQLGRLWPELAIVATCGHGQAALEQVLAWTRERKVPSGVRGA